MIRKLLVVTLLLLSCVSPRAQQGGACGQNAVVNAQGAATVKLVPDPSGTARVFVCGWNLNAGAAASAFQFQGGTGGACAGGNAVLSGTYNIAINGSNTDSSAVARGMATVPGAGLCLVVTGTGPLNGNVYYNQQ
jgi:hypothetical protein